MHGVPIRSVGEEVLYDVVVVVAARLNISNPNFNYTFIFTFTQGLFILSFTFTQGLSILSFFVYLDQSVPAEVVGLVEVPAHALRVRLQQHFQHRQRGHARRLDARSPAGLQREGERGRGGERGGGWVGEGDRVREGERGEREGGRERGEREGGRERDRE